MLINMSLLVLGIIALTQGINYLLKEGYLKEMNIYIVIMGIFTFFWCDGYALMGMVTDFELAFLFRNIGLFGVLAFMAAEALFLAYISMKSKKRKYLVAVIVIISIVDFILFSQEQVLTFTRVGDRTCYYANESFARIFHSTYLVGIFLFMAFTGIKWYRQVTLKREKILVRLMFLVNFCLVFASFPDTFMPLLHKPSIPASGYGVFAAYVLICYMATKYNAFSLSVQNLSKYIYEYVNFPVVAFSHDGFVALVNDFGRKFLNMEEDDRKHLYDLFEISKEDADEIFREINNQGMEKDYRLITLNTRKICSLNFTAIEDPYGDIYCIICFINDISREAKKLEELDYLRENLEGELSVKSKQVERITLQSITAIANTIDAKDEYTKGHSVRVAEYCEKIAEGLGWKNEEIQNLKYIALLHDIGKIGVPDAVLNKPGKLTDIEFDLIKSHTTIGGEILKDIVMIDHVADGARYHHERYDGKGYPSGLIGPAIPIEARIICVADAYDAMNSNRVYRKRMTEERIREQMISGRGTQFDPVFLDKFMELFDSGKIKNIEQTENKESTFVEEGNLLLERIISEMDNQKQISEERDYLTQLLSRKTGEKRIISAIAEGEGCLALIDMDNLKQVNDIFGHLSGDYVLKKLSEVLIEHSDNAIVARLGGDEFLYYMRCSEKKEIESVIEGIIHSFQCRKENDEVMTVVSLSIGLCINKKGESYETVFQNADRALYYVKQTGKCGYYFYRDSIHTGNNESSVDLRKLMASLKRQGNYTGAFNVKYREFVKIYDFINNLAQRYKYSMQLIMITAQYSTTGDFELEKQEHLMNCMNSAIRESLRNVDVASRFSSVQYLVILVNADSEKVGMIIERILQRFYKTYDDRNVDISYDVQEFDIAQM